MNVAPQLSKDEFKDIHNGLCELRNLKDQLAEFLAGPAMQRFEKGISLIRSGLDRAYEQDDAAFEKAEKKFNDLSEKYDFKTIWSMYEVEDENAAPFPNATSLLYAGHEVELEKNSTWVELWKAADKVVALSGDYHHIFIEDFTEKDGVLYLQTGS